MNQRSIALHLDSNQLAAIGLFAAHWAYFETEMDFTISAMSFSVYRDSRMPFPFDDRVKHWQKLLPKLFAEKKHAIPMYEGIIAKAKKAHDTRSKFIHARAIGDDQRRTRAICFEHNQHRMGKWKVSPVSITPRKISSIARAIGELTTALISLNRRYLPVSPKSLPCTYPAPPRDGPYRMRRGHSGSSALRTPPRSSRG
jgi:hypothetical protein